MGLIFKRNYTFILTKLICVDEEQDVFEQLTLINSKRWGLTALKIFNNYSIIINNKIDNIRIS